MSSPAPGIEVIDFDANATVPLRPELRERWISLLARNDGDGNPSSVHRAGQRARALLEDARRRLSGALGAEPLSVVFTSGGTEANNLAVLGAARRLRTEGKAHGLALSPLEHPCVLDAAKRLQSEGHALRWLGVDRKGRLDENEIRAAADDPKIGWIGFQLAQHELGNVYPVQEWTKSIRARRDDVLIHCDAVQAVGKQLVDFRELDVDTLAVSAHKFGGPKGIGALLHRRGLSLDAIVIGGSQERGLRGGTPSPLLAQLMADATQFALAQREVESERCQRIFEIILRGISDWPNVEVLGDPQAGHSRTICLKIDDCAGETLMIALDLEGVLVSTGAACSVGSSQVSPGLLAMGLSEKEARSVIRISWSAARTPDDARRLLEILDVAIARMRASSQEVYS